MNLYLLNNSFELIEKEEVENLLEEFLSLIDYINENSDSKVFLCEDIYSVQFFDDLKLYEWLFVDEKYEPELNELKILFRKALDRKMTICEEDDYVNITDEIEKTQSQDVSEQCFICFKEMSENVSYIKSIEELIKAFRVYLKKNCTCTNFIILAKDAFPKLYFRREIENTLQTLSAPLQQYKIEVCRHLAGINDHFKEVYDANSHKGLNAVVSIFQAESGIKCTLEGDSRSKNERLNFIFKTIDNKEIKLLCEPHTKLEKTGQAGDGEYRYDRIYFHQGDDRVSKGKILIAYIGEHL